MTDFARRVYQIVKAIPAGEVRTYGEVATAAGYPKAARAVGTAMNRNQHSFLIDAEHPQAVPCHRVVGAGLRLGGFNAGKTNKQRLLEQEGWQLVGDQLKSSQEQGAL